MPNYMEKIQTDITANMRGILVDWLVEVTEEYKLIPDTLYLAVSYIDRFLSMNCIVRKRLQLLGVVSMLIAAKYEEIRLPNVDDFCCITDYTYKKSDVVKMEADVLKSLNFVMGSPTLKTFLRKFISNVQRGNVGGGRNLRGGQVRSMDRGVMVGGSRRVVSMEGLNMGKADLNMGMRGKRRSTDAPNMGMMRKRRREGTSNQAWSSPPQAALRRGSDDDDE